MDLFLILLQTFSGDLLLPIPCFLMSLVGILFTYTAEALKTTIKISVLSKMLGVVLVQPVGMFAVPRQPGTG